MSSQKHKIRRAVAGALLLGMGILLPIEQAYAVSAGMAWQTQQTVSMPSSVNELYSSLDNNKVYVDNNLGGAVALIKLNAAQVKMITDGGNAFNMPYNSPVVFANYDPASSSGVIFVVRLIKQPGGAGIIQMAQFTPSMGGVFSQDFDNTNPFWQFIPGQNGNGAGPNAGSFVSTTPAAFYTAVGLVMQHVQSGIGWIAAANTTSHMSTTSSSDFFTSTVTHKETANTAPVWTVVLPEGAAPGAQMGYLLPVPNTASGSDTAAVAALAVDQENDPHAIGETTNAVAQMSNGYVGQLGVHGGYVYVQAGAGATLPVTAFQSFNHSTSKTGINGIVFDLIMAVVTAVTFGATAPALFAGIGAMEAAAAGAVAGFVTGMVYDTVTTGSPGFTNIQEHLIGGNCGASAKACLSGGAPVAMNAAYTSAQAFDGMQEGYTTQDTNPTQQQGQWDYTPASSAAIEQTPQNVQGGFGQGYSQNESGNFATVQKGETLTQMKAQAQTNSSGYINFGNTAGQLPSGGVP